jgi:hypothetical protein
LINQVNANERRGTLKQNKFELRTQAEDIRDQVGLLIIIIIIIIELANNKIKYTVIATTS